MRLKNNLLPIIAAMTIGSVFISCEDFADDYLSQTNPNEMNTSIFWTNLDECQSGLASVYNAFKDPSVFKSDVETLRSDLGCGGTSMGANSNNKFYIQDFNRSTPEIGEKWSAIYKGVFFANQVIQGLDNVKAKEGMELDEKRWNLLMGQARFFRGLFYFYLSTSFNNGEVPIFDFVPTNTEEFYVPCSTAEDVKAFYRNDLEFAEANLPKKGASNDWTKESGNLGRPNSETASAVLGTSYLYDADFAAGSGYEKPTEYFEKIIKTGAYDLVGVGDNAYTTNELNKETLLEVIYTYDFKSEYKGGSVESLTTLMNKWFSLNAVGGSTVTTPPFWLYYKFMSEPVDRLNPQNKVMLHRDSHGDIYFSHDPKAGTEVVSLGGVPHEIYPVMARPKDLITYVNPTETDIFAKRVDYNKTLLKNANKVFDVYAKSYASAGVVTYDQLNDDQKKILAKGYDDGIGTVDKAMSMTWSDSLYIIGKKKLVSNTSNDRMIMNQSPNEGYEMVTSNFDMCPARPQQGDRSLGAVKIYENGALGSATTKEGHLRPRCQLPNSGRRRYSLSLSYSFATYKVLYVDIQRHR